MPIINIKTAGIVLGLFMVVTGSCRRKVQEKQILAPESVRKTPSQEMWKSNIRISKNGNSQAIISYGYMVEYDGQKKAFFDKGVQVDFFDEFGKHTSTLTSLRGEYNKALNNVIGKGNVVVVSDSGYQLLTDQIRWDNLKEKIISDTSVIFITPDSDTLFGEGGFESNADLTDQKFYKTRFISHQSIDLDQLEKSFVKKDSVAADTGRTN